MRKAVLFHYMYKKNFHGARIFLPEAAFRSFLKTRYGGADDRFRQHVKKVTGGVYPFP